MNDTRTLKESLNFAAKWSPDKEAFVQAFEGDELRYTFREANERARSFANALADRGVSKGDRVAFLAKTTVEHAVGYLATFKLGAIPVTLHEREGADSVESQTRTVTPAAFVFQSSFVDEVEPLVGNVDSIGAFVEYDRDEPVASFATPFSELTQDRDAPEPDVAVDPSDVATITFTSGSTSEPKPIVHTHGELIECVHNGYLYGARRPDVFLNCFSPAFVGWQNRINSAVTVGASMVFLEEWEPAEVPSLIEEESVSVLKFVPTQWKMILQEDVDSYDLSSVRVAGYAGEPISNDLFEEIRETFTEDLLATYGTTEALRITVLFPENLDSETMNSIGRPQPHADLRLIEPGSGDPDAEVDRGEAGELIARGPTVAGELWNDSERTAALYHEDGWWFSGDLARIGEEGNLYLEGRIDNMFISGGINVYPERIESILEEHDQVVESVVVGVPDETWGRAVKAYIVAAGDPTTDDLDEFCRDHDELGDYQRPRAYEFVSEIPRTATGKADRNSLEN